MRPTTHTANHFEIEAVLHPSQTQTREALMAEIAMPVSISCLSTLRKPSHRARFAWNCIKYFTRRSFAARSPDPAYLCA